MGGKYLVCLNGNLWEKNEIWIGCCIIERNCTERDIIWSKQSGNESEHVTSSFHKDTGLKRNIQLKNYENIMGSFLRPIYTKILRSIIGKSNAHLQIVELMWWAQVSVCSSRLLKTYVNKINNSKRTLRTSLCLWSQQFKHNNALGS